MRAHIRLSIGLTVVCLALAACTAPPSPGPTSRPAASPTNTPTQSPNPTPGTDRTPSPTPGRSAVPTPAPTIPPIDGAWFDPGWTVVYRDDSSDGAGEIEVLHRVGASTHFDIAFACAEAGRITVKVVDAEAEVIEPAPGVLDPRQVALFGTDCGPDVQSFVAPGPDHETSLGAEIVLSPGFRYWLLIAVPSEAALP